MKWTETHRVDTRLPFPVIEAAAATLMDRPRQSTDIACCISNAGPGQQDGMDGLLEISGFCLFY